MSTINRGRSELVIIAAHLGSSPSETGGYAQRSAHKFSNRYIGMARRKSTPRKRTAGVGFSSIRTKGARRAPSRNRSYTNRMARGRTKGRTQTRAPTRVKMDNSPFKTQLEYYNTQILTSKAQELKETTTNGKETMGFYLSPIRGTQPDRTVNGSKARLKAINIKGSVDNDTDYPCTIRLTVAELIQVTDPPKTGTAPFTTEIDFGTGPYFGAWFKKAESQDASHLYLPFDNINNYKRAHTPINIGEFKILKQQYIDVGSANVGTGNHVTTKGFHFYTQLDREIDKDDFIQCREHKVIESSSRNNIPLRYAYSQPIVLLVEWLCRPADEIPDNTKLCNVAWTTKYTFKDGV